MAIAEKDKVKYNSFSGEIYDAIITKVYEDGRFFDIEVLIPTVKEPYPLTAVRTDRITPTDEVKE